MKFEAYLKSADHSFRHIERKVAFEIEIPDAVVKVYAEEVLGLMTYKTAMARQAVEPPDEPPPGWDDEPD